MEFGHLLVSELDAVDFTLPADPVMNLAVLPGKPSERFRFNLGLSRWGRSEWVGKLYPNKTKENDFLIHYAQHFNAIELNATHYKVYQEGGTKKWKELTNNPDFRFCPKMYKGVTHFGSLKGKDYTMNEYLIGMGGFGEQLGPIFIQLSDKFAPKRFSELSEYLDKLPKNVNFFVEIREPEWFTNEVVFEKLKDLKLGSVITDAGGRRDCVHMHLTVSRLFVRFVANDMHPTDKVRINDWAERIRLWRSKGLEEVSFFIHSYDEAAVLEVCKYAIEVFNEVCDAKLKPLRIGGNLTLF